MEAARSHSPVHSPAYQKAPLRLLTAVAICDGHDSAIMSVNQELVRAGAEVVYLGYHRSAAEIARAAVQEDVHAVGISSYNGGHVDFFQEVAAELGRRGRSDIPLFGGGGATITRADAADMRRFGVERIYMAGTSLDRVVGDITRHFRRRRNSFGEPPFSRSDDAPLGWWLTLAEARARATAAHEALLERLGDRQRRAGAFARLPAGDQQRLRGVLAHMADLSGALEQLPANSGRAPVIGVAGPGGVGKSTLIDELVLRTLQSRPGRVAVLSNDPTAPAPEGDAAGALLGDRATMIDSQDDRVFQRSLATRRGRSGREGVSPALEDALRVLSAADFNLIFIETAGTGQEALPFAPGMVDRMVLVLSPDYGGRLQLEKMALLQTADIVVLNKADRPAGRAAAAELRARLGRTARAQALATTVASRHADLGVDELFAEILHLGAREQGEPVVGLEAGGLRRQAGVMMGGRRARR